jgi:hypothetical protein
MVKLLQEKIRSILDHIGLHNNFINRNLSAQKLREMINKWDCMKLECFCTAKDMINKLIAYKMGENLC